MTIIPFDKITPGVAPGVALNAAKPYVRRLNKVHIQALQTNELAIYVGVAAMDTATLEGVIAVLQPGGSITVGHESQGNIIEPAQIYLAAENGTDAALGSGFEV